MATDTPTPQHWSGGFSLFFPLYNTETKKYTSTKHGFIPTLKELALNALLPKMPQDLLDAAAHTHSSNHRYWDMVDYKNKVLKDFPAHYTDILPPDILEWVGGVGFWRFEKCMKLIFLDNTVYEDWEQNMHKAYGERNRPLYIKDHAELQK